MVHSINTGDMLKAALFVLPLKLLNGKQKSTRYGGGLAHAVIPTVTSVILSG
jgi:hypothetical protein